MTCAFHDETTAGHQFQSALLFPKCFVLLVFSKWFVPADQHPRLHSCTDHALLQELGCSVACKAFGALKPQLLLLTLTGEHMFDMLCASTSEFTSIRD